MREERGVSTALNYVLLVGVLALLAAGLFTGVSGYVDDQQQRAVRSEMEVVGHRLAADVAAADRLAAGRNDSVAVDVALPDRAAGTAYVVALAPAANDTYRITVTSLDTGVSVAVRVASETPVATGRVGGGDLRVVYDGAADRLEVRAHD